MKHTILAIHMVLLFASVYSVANDVHNGVIYSSPFAKNAQLGTLKVEGPNSSLNLTQLSEDRPIIMVRFLGYGCDHCVQQLVYFHQYESRLRELGIKVYAFSDDDVETCEKLRKAKNFKPDVINVLSDEDNVAATLIGARRVIDEQERDLHASLVVYKGQVLYSVFSDQPFMDVGKLVTEALKAGDVPQAESNGNAVDRYLTSAYTSQAMAGPSDGINAPLDLDFNKSPLRPDDLWVVITSNVGNAMAIISNAGKAQQNVRVKKDSRASHFMWRTMAISMGPNATFATAQNGENGDHDPFYQFMGPTLWSSDTAVFASRYQDDEMALASHLDMLHQSPMGMGIAHDYDNVFWVSDGYYGDVCRYDYRDPHEVGGTDHRDGLIWRYSDVDISRGVRGRPAHVALDHATGWLYIVDPGGNRVIRLDTKSGTIGNNLIPPAESLENLTQFVEITGATVEEVIPANINEPVGIEVVGNRLLVGHSKNGVIDLYSIGSDNKLTKMGSLQTNASELLGFCVSPNGKIWFVDRARSTVNCLKIDKENSISAAFDVRAVGAADSLQFTFINGTGAALSSSVSVRKRIVGSDGNSDWTEVAQTFPISLTALQTKTINVPAIVEDTSTAVEYEVYEVKSGLQTGAKASTICVSKNLKRVVVNDAPMENFSITDAIRQTERVGYAYLRSDVFTRIADSLPKLKTVLWYGGSFGELSVTDDAVLNSLLSRKVKLFLAADDPLLIRTDLPNSSSFFGKFGVTLRGIDNVVDDNGQRILKGVANDSVSGGLSTVDCQLPRLDHNRGGEYIPNIVFSLKDSKAVTILSRNTTSITSVRYPTLDNRTIILGINPSRFLQGVQRTQFLGKGLAWLEAGEVKDSIPSDTTTTDTTDHDTTTTDTTTSVSEINTPISLKMSIAGNPVIESTTLTIEGDANEVRLGIYSVGGQLLRELPIREVHGTTTLPLNIGDLASGTMFVIAHYAGGVSHVTIVKQ